MLPCAFLPVGEGSCRKNERWAEMGRNGQKWAEIVKQIRDEKTIEVRILSRNNAA